jgi:diguanylate cyclase (GGDEF)-like protein
MAQPRMETHPFLNASKELRLRLINLIEALAGLRALSNIRTQKDTRTDLLEQALDVLMKNQDLERCSVFLLKDDLLQCAAGRDWNDQMCSYEDTQTRPPYAFALGEGIIGHAASERRLIHSRNCVLDEQFVPIASGGRRKHTGSMICVPIMAGDELLGVLNASHPDPEFFHPWQNNVLTIFCNVLGQMLHYHSLLTEMDALVEERTQQLASALNTTEEMKQRFEQLSIIDDLTKLHNRRFFFPEAEVELARAIRNRETYTIMLVDIDHFKLVNDSYGHAVGDQVLQDVATALQAQTREGDILARFGGEEFIFALPTTDCAGAAQLAQRICDSLRQLRWQVRAGVASISVSIGFSCLPRGTEPQDYNQKAALQELLRQADIALYYCKENGRNRYRAFHDLPFPYAGAEQVTPR